MIVLSTEDPQTGKTKSRIKTHAILESANRKNNLKHEVHDIGLKYHIEHPNQMEIQINLETMFSELQEESSLEVFKPCSFHRYEALNQVR